MLLIVNNMSIHCIFLDYFFRVIGVKSGLYADVCEVSYFFYRKCLWIWKMGVHLHPANEEDVIGIVGVGKFI